MVVEGCRYCYANSNIRLVKKNQKLHNPDSPLLIGDLKNDDVVKEVKEPSYIDKFFKVSAILFGQLFVDFFGLNYHVIRLYRIQLPRPIKVVDCELFSQSTG